jgi:mannose-6-phosphate isomerase
MSLLYPLRFQPIFRAYLWGGRRFETVLHKKLPPGDHWAESWEIADHGPDQSIVAHGPLAGTTLGELVRSHGKELLGRHQRQPQFPLLVKFLDAAEELSVQVHPDDARAARLSPPDSGKTEAWVVLESQRESVIYAGLKPGVDRAALAEAIRQGRCLECLHRFHPSPGDCVFIPAGTVHALGAGLLVAEIQQSSDVTYRLFDWNRVGTDGRPRELHIDQGLEAIDFDRGPVEPQCSSATDRPEACRLVDCDKFQVDCLNFDQSVTIGDVGDLGWCESCHILIVLDGAVEISGDFVKTPLSRGETILLPAFLGDVQLHPQRRTILLDVLPKFSFVEGLSCL